MTLPNRTLAVIADELHAALKRETADILTIGGLLIEAKANVDHGKWLTWLKGEFSISERSAQKYIKAAEFVVKNELGADLNLSPSALYLLSEDSYWQMGYGREKATDAVIKAARQHRVASGQAKEIIDNILAEEAKQKACENAKADAMADDMEKAERDATERQEPWSDKKPKWIEEWIAKNWGDEQEAKFETEWQAMRARNHGLAEQVGAAALEYLGPEAEATGAPFERPPSPRTAGTHTGHTRPRGAAAADRDRRRGEGGSELCRAVEAIKKIVCAPHFNDTDREVFRRTYSPHLDGFIDQKGKCRFEPSQFTAVEATLITGDPQDNEVSPQPAKAQAA